MLTGDKIETAKCIAISTGLKSSKQSMFEMREMTLESDIRDAIDRFSLNVHTQMLIVDGNTLAVILQSSILKNHFFQVA